MKELLEKLASGEVTVDDVLKAIDDENKDKVPRSRLNDKIDEVKELQKQISDRDKQLEDLKTKASGNEELQKQIQELQEQNDKIQTDYETKMQQRSFDFALEKALATAKAKNPKAVKAPLNVDSIRLDGDTLLGLEDQLKALQESDAYLFDSGEPAGLKGRTPHPSDPNKQQTVDKNPFSKEHFNLTEQARLYKEDPELYKKLKAQA